jgi:hypothetical protein
MNNRRLGEVTMQYRKGWALAAALLALALPLTACGSDSEQAVEEAVVVEQEGDTDLYRITLTAKAAKRLDIRTAAVEQSGTGTVIPYAAVIYSPTGETWAYVNSKGLTFVRRAIVIDRIDGDQALLSEGPAAGTKVATVGVQELFGSESGVGGGH